MSLGMVEKDYGSELARSVAQKLVLYHRRAGGQSSISEGNKFLVFRVGPEDAAVSA